MPLWVYSKKGRKTRNECVLAKEHVKYCKTLKPQCVSYSNKEDASVQFTFMGYSDFECTLKPENDVDVLTGIDQSEKKSTQVKYQAHTPASYFPKFVLIVPDSSLPEKYVGENAAEHYFDYVHANAIYEKYIKKLKKMKFIKDDRKKFEAASACHICEQEFVRAVLNCPNK